MVLSYGVMGEEQKPGFVAAELSWKMNIISIVSERTVPKM